MAFSFRKEIIPLPPLADGWAVLIQTVWHLLHITAGALVVIGVLWHELKPRASMNKSDAWMILMILGISWFLGDG
jgi:hypothetical protein